MPEIRECTEPYVQAMPGHKIWPYNQHERTKGTQYMQYGYSSHMNGSPPR